MKEKIYFRSSELKQRGWTDGLIKKFLPKPDETKTNPIVKSAAPMKLYKIKRVERIEKSALDGQYPQKAHNSNIIKYLEPQSVRLLMHLRLYCF